MRNQLPVPTGQSTLPTQYIPTAKEVKDLICPKATNTEIALFIETMKATGLNVFLREIYLIKYDQNNPASIVVGYQTYLQIAEASGKLNGWKVELDDEKNPTKATITIYRKDWDHPFIHTVYRAEVDTATASSKPKAPWKKMPRFMLIKCVIGQGMRLCLPNVFRGTPYLPEELSLEQTSEDLPAQRIDHPSVINGEFSTLDEDQPGFGSTNSQQRKDAVDKALKNAQEAAEPTDDTGSNVLSDEEFRAYRGEYFPLAAKLFETNEARRNWQKVTTDIESIKNWTAAEFKYATKLLKEMAEKMPASNGEGDGESLTLDEMIKTFPDGKPLPTPVKDTDAITFYLNVRFLTLELESRLEIAKFVSGCFQNKSRGAKFLGSVGKATAWGEQIGGRGKARSFIAALNAVLDSLPDPEASMFMLQTTFSALGIVKPKDGIFRLIDVSPTIFDNWNDAINAATKLTIGNFIGETTKEDEADDDLPF